MSAPMPDSNLVSNDGEEAASNSTADVIDPARSLRTTLRGLATLVAPTSVVTSLLYYFGWTRASRQSQACLLYTSPSPRDS